MQYSHKIAIDVIKADELMRDAVYVNPIYNFKQRYTPDKKTNEGKL